MPRNLIYSIRAAPAGNPSPRVGMHTLSVGMHTLSKVQLAHVWTGLSIKSNSVAVVILALAILWGAKNGAFGAVLAWVILNLGIWCLAFTSCAGGCYLPKNGAGTEGMFFFADLVAATVAVQGCATGPCPSIWAGSMNSVCC